MTLIDKEVALDALMAERKHLLDNGQMGAEHILTHHGYNVIDDLPAVQPTIVRCYECKHNPKKAWFGCPMAHLNERQRPEDAWCWKGEREAK